MILVDLFTQAQSLTQMSIGLSGAAVKAELTLVVDDWATAGTELTGCPRAWFMIDHGLSM